MIIDSFLCELKNKYDYNAKLTRALGKILPSMTKYYGYFSWDIIKSALLDCEIIMCDSYSTIGMVIKRLNLINIDESTFLIKEDLNYVSGIYLSRPKVNYDDILNSYVIDGVRRYIILSHTYNLDSARGLASLTSQLCKLIKSYKNEFVLKDDVIIKRTGLEKKFYKIVNQNEITLKLTSYVNVGIEEGINSYDEQEILKIILGDNYETFDYQNTKSIALCLKDRLGLKEKLDCCEINGNTSDFIYEYEGESDLFSELSLLADDSCILENKKNNYDITKEERDSINDEIKFLINRLVNNLIEYKKRAKISEF